MAFLMPGKWTDVELSTAAARARRDFASSRKTEGIWRIIKYKLQYFRMLYRFFMGNMEL